jgi:hypothetical protein
MSYFEASSTVDVASNVLFDYLSDVERLPEYLPQVEHAHRLHEGPPPSEPYQLGEPGETGVEQVTVDLQPEGGPPIHGKAWIEVVQHGRKLRWGTGGTRDYHGELDVDFVADGTSLLTVRLYTEHTGGPDIEKELEESLATIKASAESRASRPREVPDA